MTSERVTWTTADGVTLVGNLHLPPAASGAVRVWS